MIPKSISISNSNLPTFPKFPVPRNKTITTSLYDGFYQQLYHVPLPLASSFPHFSIETLHYNVILNEVKNLLFAILEILRCAQ
ncbi:MAG: hypothetical protein AAB116_23940, partial [Candidatus Poribacteria bacterium]